MGDQPDDTIAGDGVDSSKENDDEEKGQQTPS